MTIPMIAFSQADISRIYFLVCTAIILTPFILIRNALAVDACIVRAAQVVSVQGTVEVRRHQSASWEPAAFETQLCAGDSLRVRTHSRAAIRLNNDSVMRLDQRTTITIPETEANKITTLIDLIKGAIHIITRTPLPFKVRTPFLNAGVEGTEFSVALGTGHARVVIFEGRVSASNEHGSVMLAGHEAAIAYQHRPPLKETIVRPLDAVQWALYYPAIIGYHRNQGSDNTDNRIAQAEYLLSVGQADEAGIILDRLLADDPGNSAAIALQSIIAVVQNDKDRALELAQQAVKNDDLSAPARLALSYAQQAAFDINAALASVKQAVTLDPQNALIWARLSELHMSVGELEQALESAQEAVNLNPTIAKTQTVLGFAYLLQINTKEAQSIFHEAILLDQADPMPRLGLGLALIREGQLEAGRIQLEIAASLDPGNSLIRSYLGKAYFEEKRYSLAETQFELAKELDPLDPTPWFYDAIQKQTQNRPVEALQDIQKSIELNDNRAVYRSRLLLDQDQAGRGSSLARIYDNLGFDKRAIVETAKSLSHDPSNHSAHRFLADTYARIPRHEVARVSELLQAQLLQPINLNPVQPHAAVPDLNIITSTGPFSTGFNEFTPLMERNKPQLVASGVVGNQGTLGNEIVFSQLYDRTSVSLGQFHYETNGFRPNNDQNHNIYNAFIQHAFTPKLNIQAEVRTQEKEHGDIELDFNPKSFDKREKREFRKNTVRLGAKYSLSEKQDIILSTIYGNRKFEGMNLPQFSNLRNNLYQVEAQYLFRDKYFNMIIGGGASFRESNSSNPSPDINDKYERKNAYLYTFWNLPNNISTTLGFSYSSFHAKRNSVSAYQINEFDPKLGIQWDLTKDLRLRLAWIETIKNDLLVQQTIEPTQVAGFNQFFDDPNGTKSKRQGVGLDLHILSNLYGGIESSIRKLKIPFIDKKGDHEQTEQIYRAYLYGLINTNWSVTGEFAFESFKRNKIIAGSNPSNIQTLSSPVSINYFNPGGIFAKVTGTFVRQNIDRGIPILSDPNIGKTEGLSDFFIVDAVAGYRLPARRGLLSFEVKNIFNEDFYYRNTWLQVSEPVLPRYIPSRTFFLQLTLNY